MIPLTLTQTGDEVTINKVCGGADLKRFTESLGFVAGGAVTVISKSGGNIIVKVKDSRVAVSEEMAKHIMV